MFPFIKYSTLFIARYDLSSATLQTSSLSSAWKYWFSTPILLSPHKTFWVLSLFKIALYHACRSGNRAMKGATKHAWWIIEKRYSSPGRNPSPSRWVCLEEVVMRVWI